MAPCVLLDGFDVWLSDYEVWRMNYDRFAYRGLSMKEISTPPGYLTAQKGTKPKEGIPGPLDPVDDLPPITVITHVTSTGAGKLIVRGTTSDNAEVTKVIVNGAAAKALRPNFAEWEITLDVAARGPLKLIAHAEDSAKNIEATPHVVVAIGAR